MYSITEFNSPDGIYFEKNFISENGKIISNERVHIHTTKLTYEGIEYIFLYDVRMNPISSVFDYLNFELEDASPNHRYTALSALKLLYSFLHLFDLNIESLTNKDINNLLNFLEGNSKKGTLFQLDLKTLRGPSTINTYTTIYRSFIIYLGLVNSPLLKKSSNYKLIFNNNSDSPMKIYQYEIGRKNYKTEISTPRYISIEDFRKILDVIRKNYTFKEECIIRLMFENGLRIGEVLGITNEDIVTNTKGNFIYIRNRCSDSAFQLAKGCIIPKTFKDYSTSKYKTHNIGYQVINISESLLELINDYVNEDHQNDNQNFRKNYNRYTMADATENLMDNSVNFYLFINSIGRPLSQNLWGKTLREIFKKAGLNVDKAQRETNLSHRFRHGYAMFMIKYKSVDELTLKMLLRHNSINSVTHYYRPTDEDIVKVKTELVESIYQIIPELNI